MSPPASPPPPQLTDPEMVIVPDVGGLARAAADRVRGLAGQAIAARGRFRLTLAGGSTPRALYRELVASTNMDWNRIEVFFGDERPVGPDDPESNYRMARETLLLPAAVPPENVRRLRGEDPDLDAVARAYEATLVSGAEPPLLDLALLGMGADGHTASLFPGTDALEEEQRLCTVVDVPQLGRRRLTLTYPVLLGARDVLFLIAGADKAETLRDVLGPVTDRRRWPSQPLLRRAQPRPALLFCDREAAHLLPTSEVT